MTLQRAGGPGRGTARIRREVARVRASGAFGRKRPPARAVRFPRRARSGVAPASQAEIAEDVFGQVDSDGDDATVRVYVHRLRKRLDQFYADAAAAPRARLADHTGGELRARLLAPVEARQVARRPGDAAPRGGSLRCRWSRLWPWRSSPAAAAASESTRHPQRDLAAVSRVRPADHGGGRRLLHVRRDRSVRP